MPGNGWPSRPTGVPPGREIVIAGREAHVCVLQTTLDLIGARQRVIVAADATGSRDPADRAAGITTAPA